MLPNKNDLTAADPGPGTGDAGLEEQRSEHSDLESAAATPLKAASSDESIAEE